MKTARLIFGLTALALSLPGCSGFGNRDFACPGYPGHPLCLPTSEIYRLTDGSEAPPAAMVRGEGHGGDHRAPDPFAEDTP
jgi:hypothetical protein